MSHFSSISGDELERVCGGGAAWDAYVRQQRAHVAAPYKQVVCTAAGVKGGREFATQVYGADRATNGDMIRAAQTLQGVCAGGSRLPVQAPPSPF